MKSVRNQIRATMKKSEIRKIYLEKRKSLSKDEVLSLSKLIFKNFINHFKLIENQKVHIFLPIQKFNEINTFLFIDYFFKNKIRVFVPKMVGENLISIEINEKTQFIKNSWGISEPISNEDSCEKVFDFVITPLLYSDNQGNRVGYGKGFYDKFFSTLNSKTKKIGINYFDPDGMIDDVEAFDIPLDYLVTPTDVLSFFKGC